MPLAIISQNIIDTVAGRVQLSSSVNDQDLRIDEAVIVMTTDSEYTNGIEYGANDHDIEVRGTVIGNSAVVLGSGTAVSTGNTLTVTATGHLVGEHAGAELIGSAVLTNAGAIKGGLFGLRAYLDGTSTLKATNTGLIAGEIRGFVAEQSSLQGSTTVEFTNLGTLKGSVAYSGTRAKDHLVNAGKIMGDVATSHGADTFDNVGGTVTGKIYLGEGDDVFRPGLGAETASGNAEFPSFLGGGVDTLDFKSSGGVTVNLLTGTGTGRAAGDVYVGFERVWGSDTGADAITGDDGANILLGHGGADRLSGGASADTIEGGAGADVIVGGVGKDMVTGGTGNDTFVLRNSGSDRDLVKDFHNVSGDNDRLQLSAAVLGEAAGALDADLFRARADNHAQDSNDRLIFRTADATLWLDMDGSGAGAAAMIADLQAGAVLSAGDFLLV